MISLAPVLGFSVLGIHSGDTQNTSDLGTGVPKTRGHPNHCDTATQPEANLIDIKEMLVDIQITVATIPRENQDLKQEILELKSALNANQKETEKLKSPFA